MLIIGLGNPGKEYALTRHNAGFMAADSLAQSYGAKFETWSGGKAQFCKISICGQQVCLFKPLSFMNLSGGPARAYADFFKIPPSKILVVFDDLSLPFGVLRLRAQGSAGGHNGMQSVIESFGTQNIARLRVGIGPRPPHFEGKDFVLSKFSTQEVKMLPDILARAASGIEDILGKSFDIAASEINKTQEGGAAPLF